MSIPLKNSVVIFRGTEEVAYMVFIVFPQVVYRKIERWRIGVGLFTKLAQQPTESNRQSL